MCHVLQGAPEELFGDDVIRNPVRQLGLQPEPLTYELQSRLLVHQSLLHGRPQLGTHTPAPTQAQLLLRHKADCALVNFVCLYYKPLPFPCILLHALMSAMG